MLTQEENDRLTRVGSGTPMGELLRRYWHPVGTRADLDKDPVHMVRLLGEDLVLFKRARRDRADRASLSAPGRFAPLWHPAR